MCRESLAKLATGAPESVVGRIYKEINARSGNIDATMRSWLYGLASEKDNTQLGFISADIGRIREDFVLDVVEVDVVENSLLCRQPVSILLKFQQSVCTQLSTACRKKTLTCDRALLFRPVPERLERSLSRNRQTPLQFLTDRQEK